MKPEIKYITNFPDTETTYSEDAWYNHHDDSFVILNCHAANIYYPEHWTPLSIKCAFNGKEYYKLKNTTYAVDDRNFLLLNEGNFYSSYINSESITESLTLNFTKKNIADLSAFIFYSENNLLADPFKISPVDVRVYEKLYPHSQKTNAYLNKIKNYKYQDGNDTTQLLETLYLFLYELVNFNNIISSEIDNVQAKKRSTREELYRRLHMAKDYIQSCYNENISLDSLSKICYLNSFHLLREFKKCFGTTPHKYLTGIRLQYAKEIITKTDLKLVDVISQVGFEDESSFSKLFKKHHGKSPQFFRQGYATSNEVLAN
jgi:AraC family transcriptional regulator